MGMNNKFMSLNNEQLAPQPIFTVSDLYLFLIYVPMHNKIHQFSFPTAIYSLSMWFSFLIHQYIFFCGMPSCLT